MNEIEYEGLKTCEEMVRLIEKLKMSHIPFEIGNNLGTVQLFYPTKHFCDCDVICYGFSYGYEEGLLEIMGLVDEEAVGDTVEGWLTADEVFTRIKDHFIENN